MTWLQCYPSTLFIPRLLGQSEASLKNTAYTGFHQFSKAAQSGIERNKAATAATTRGSAQQDCIRNALQDRLQPTNTRAFSPHSGYNTILNVRTKR